MLELHVPLGVILILPFISLMRKTEPWVAEPSPKAQVLTSSLLLILLHMLSSCNLKGKEVLNIALLPNSLNGSRARDGEQPRKDGREGRRGSQLQTQ